MARYPQVLETSPKNYETDVPVNVSLSATMSTYIDQNHLDPYIYLLDAEGTHIEGRIVLKRKVIVFTPFQPLDPGKSYQFVLQGDNDLTDNKEDGIRSITGESMQGNTVVTFTTEVVESLPAPEAVNPTRDSVIKEIPTIRWTEVIEANSYQFYLSRSNRFDTLVYPDDTNQKIYETFIDPNIEWTDGIYYWKVRSINETGVHGEWSTIYQFHLDRSEEGTISEDDTLPIEMFYENANIELEVVESFPNEESVQIPINLKSIYFRVIGDIDINLLDKNSFRVTGEHLTQDEYEPSHGEVSGQISIVSHDDGTNYIIFTPDVLSVETNELAGES